MAFSFGGVAKGGHEAVYFNLLNFNLWKNYSMDHKTCHRRRNLGKFYEFIELQLAEKNYPVWIIKLVTGEVIKGNFVIYRVSQRGEVFQP